VARARNLLKIHALAHGKRSKPPRYLADAHRAAITLAISALDAYVRTFVITRVRSVLAGPGPVPRALGDRLKKLLSHDQALEAARAGDFLDCVFRPDLGSGSDVTWALVPA